MPVKRILLPINGTEDVTAVADLAFAVARRVTAEVEVLHPHMAYYDAVTSVSEGGSAAQIAHDLEAARQRFEDEKVVAKQLFSAFAKQNEGIACNFVQMEGRTGDIVTRRAYSSDLVALGSAEAYDTQFWRDVYDAALIHSTRPVLVAPSDPRNSAGQPFAEEVLVAWNGTAESARAMTAAQPFFASADKVRILTVGGDTQRTETAHQMQEYAALHGAKAEVNVIETDGSSIAETLLGEASANVGTLLVMGAYSHARWRERFFGGVTQYVLHNAEVPVLMAH